MGHDRHDSGGCPGARQWWPVLLGACWIGASAWVWATRAGVLLAGHPAYAVLTTLVGIVGLLVVVRALRAGRRDGRRDGRTGLARVGHGCARSAGSPPPS